MPGRPSRETQPLKGDDRVARERGAALAEFYKAFKAVTFYPEGHPLRDEILLRAHQALTALMAGDRLTLAAHRNGLVLEGLEGGVEDTRMTKALARELFTREIQKLTILPGLSGTEFASFLTLLAMEPQRIISEGGMAGILERNGISSVITNEIDIAAVYTKRSVSGEQEGPPAGDSWDGLDEIGEKTAENGRSRQVELPLDRLDSLSIGEILDLMENEENDGRYLYLARLLVAKGMPLKEEGDFDPLFPVLLFLLNHSADEKLSAARREAATDAFRETARGGMSDHLLDHLEDEEFRQSEIVYLILNQIGGEIVEDIVRRIAGTDRRHTRKALTTALLRMGSAAARPMLALLNNDNRHVVRAAVAVLGDMRCRDAVRGLTLTAYHVDNRIRFESIRSLAEIGGKEATDVLLDLLGDGNKTIRRHAILWLGITRNEKALQPLLDLIARHDFRGRDFTLKKEALLAVGRIGDRRALEPLFRLVRKRRLIASSRWDEIKSLAVEVIGRLGGDAAVDFLEKTAARGGRIGRASAAVLETVREKREESHE